MELEKIVLKAKEKDKESIELISNSFKPFIIKQCRLVYLKDYDFDDLMQICYVSLLNAISKYNPENKNFTAYVTTAIKNNLNYLIRQKAKDNFTESLYKETGEDLTLIDLLQDNYSIEATIETKADIAALKLVLKTLSAEEINLLNWVYFKRNSLLEYANINSLNYTNLRKQKERILKKLKAGLL